MKENQQKNLTRIQLTKDSASKLDNIKKMLCSNDEETAKLAIGILNEEFPTYAMKDSLYQKCGSIIFITRPLINQDPITLIISIENILKQGYYIFDFDNETIQIIEKTENNVGEFNSNVTIKR